MTPMTPVPVPRDPVRPLLAFHADRFATRVRKWRGHRMQRCVAKELGIHASILSRVECGGLPTLLIFMTLCAAMQADPREFVYERQEGE